MSVRLRKDGRWQLDIVVWQNGRRVRVKRSAKAKNKQEALKAERQERARLESGGASNTGTTFAEFAVDFLDTYAAVNNKPSEVTAKRMIVRKHLGPFLGAMQLEKIDALTIERYKAARLADGLSPKTVNNHLACLRRALVMAVEWKRLAVLPRVKFLRVPKRKADFLSFSEATRLLAAADREWRPMILLGMRTGMRRGELMALRWDDVDLEAGRVVVRQSIVNGIVGTPKNGLTREVPLSDEAVAALRGLPSRFARGLVFPHPSGRHFTPSEVWTGLNRAARAAGLRTLGWHHCRHTFASHLAMRGVPLKSIQELGGWADLGMVMRYAHLSPDVNRDAVKLLDGDGSQGTFRARSEAN